MKIAVVGTGHLAETTGKSCQNFFELCAPRQADLVWFCEDTPVHFNDQSDTDHVFAKLYFTLCHTDANTPVLISSQVPVGFCAKVEAQFPDHHLAVQPENIRKAHAMADFKFQNRMIVGTRHEEDHELIEKVLKHFTPGEVMFMAPEDAEMAKHALNTFLAMEIAFANEVNDLCELVGADPKAVFRGFRSDRRVGGGPLSPGDPYRGGTLGRDVRVLNDIGAGPLIKGIKASNDDRL